MTDIRSLLVAHPQRVFLFSSLSIALFALTPTPTLIPIIALITSLKLTTSTFIHRHNRNIQGIAQATALSVAASLASLAPALQALSVPTTSLLVLTACSFVFSAVAIFVVVSAHYASRFSQTPWTKLVLFPALWATVWGFISQISPVGQLATWSPVVGSTGPYAWTRPYLGQWGINWCAAAWATILSEAIGIWIVGDDDQGVDNDSDGYSSGVTMSKASSDQRARWLLTTTLLFLIVPSAYFSQPSLPPHGIDSTPIGVSCVLPVVRYIRKDAHHPTLDDYIRGTQQVQGSSTIILWPESAVRFDSAEEKKQAFERIQNKTSKQKYIGVSFEEYTPPALRDGIHYPEIRRNGFALLGSTGPPVLEYYKRKLVPVAESFSLAPGHEDPGMFTLQLGNPKPWSPSDWAPGPNHTRPIPLTASICLDFSTPASFQHLPERPSLILGPARSWHIGIANAMWEQAKARAEETGSIVLWCDGGKHGVSGVAGGGHYEYMQVGQGSWSRTIGVPYPAEEHRTLFLWGGKYLALIVIWSTLGAGWAVEALVLKVGELPAKNGLSFIPLLKLLPRSLITRALSWRNRRAPDVEHTQAPTESTRLINAD